MGSKKLGTATHHPNKKWVSVFLLTIILMGLIPACSFQNKSEDNSVFFHKIRSLCSQKKWDQCIQIIKNNYESTNSIKRKSLLLKLAMTVYISSHQEIKALESFIQWIGFEDKSCKDCCNKVNVFLEIIQKYSAWNLAEKVISYLVSQKLKYLSSCEDKMKFSLATALYKQRKFSESQEVLKALADKASDASLKEQVQLLFARTSFLLEDYSQCIQWLEQYEGKLPINADQGSMVLLLSTCLQQKSDFKRALLLLESLDCCKHLVDFNLVKSKIAVVKKRLTLLKERIL